MFRGFSDKDRAGSADEAVEVFYELIFIELFDTLTVMFTVVGESVDSCLSSVVFRVTVIDEGDSVLHGEVIDGSDTVEFLVHTGKSFL